MNTPTWQHTPCALPLPRLHSARTFPHPPAAFPSRMQERAVQQPGTYCKWHHLLLTWQFLCGLGTVGKRHRDIYSPVSCWEVQAQALWHSLQLGTGCPGCTFRTANDSLCWMLEGEWDCAPLKLNVPEACGSPLVSWHPLHPGRFPQHGSVLWHEVAVPRRGLASGDPSCHWCEGGR